ncbi:Eukaryotic translation initiation factor 3 subunit M [Cyberlindnera fabianii]|uniref:Eukaryotic translation initiation factor 3 subunit M n=1 Tax=Cyberlindnera fabianii TaxID=36022 RepID=A0A1V2LEP2_CYBFA|nr:Eukaryotic translation initiation factor 3 subunit M [Cyberlindnera fabianii]
MPAHLVAEDTLHDAVGEYAALLDHFSGSSNLFADKFSTFITEETEEDVEYSPEVFTYVSGETAETLAQTIPDKDLESVVNLVVFILLQQESSKFETSVQEWFTNLITAQQFGDKVEKNKKKTLKVLSLISNLSAVYNLDVSATLKQWLLTQIVHLVRILDDVKILKPFVTNAENIIDSNSASEETRSLLVEAAQLYSTVDAQESLKLLQLAATKISPASPELIEKLIIKSLNTSTALDLTHLTSDSTITSSAPSALVTLLEQYHSLPTSEFAPLLASTSISSLDTTTVLSKNKTLTLLTLAQSTPVLTYSEISKALDIPETQVELVLIDAIKRGAIEGKINQIKSEFHVFGVKLIVKKIELQDWKDIKEKLLVQKKALGEIRSLVENVQKKNKKN